MDPRHHDGCRDAPGSARRAGAAKPPAGGLARGAGPIALCASIAIPAGALAAAAQGVAPAYPERPIRLLVGFAPGGATDLTARAVAADLATRLGQDVVIDNRPGAAGNVAAAIAARAAPDGHTLLMGTIAALAINPALYGDLPFDPVRDFSPITQAASSTSVLIVDPAFRARTIKALIGLAKANPGKTTYASSGAGSSGHLAGELFSAMAKVKLAHRPRKGLTSVLTELAENRVQCAFVAAIDALPHIPSRLTPLGVTTRKRAALLPEVPTIAEQGLPGFDANNWYGLLAPAHTPRAIVARLNAEIVGILHAPEVRQHLLDHGLDPAPSRPEDFSAYIRAEVSKWAKVVRDAGTPAI